MLTMMSISLQKWCVQEFVHYTVPKELFAVSRVEHRVPRTLTASRQNVDSESAPRNNGRGQNCQGRSGLAD